MQWRFIRLSSYAPVAVRNISSISAGRIISCLRQGPELNIYRWLLAQLLALSIPTSGSVRQNFTFTPRKPGFVIAFREPVTWGGAGKVNHATNPPPRRRRAHRIEASALAKNGKARCSAINSGISISCVPFAVAPSGIDLQGNAANWWYAAAGVYERGNRPEQGAVMDFRASGRMWWAMSGVIAPVVSSREVEIDHANWWGPNAGKGTASPTAILVDVSENNDWSAVRSDLASPTARIRQRLLHLRLHL